MFYGQNCSGRLGEKKVVICVVGAKNDYDFTKLIRELNLKNIKKELNEKHFNKALELIRKYKIKSSLFVINTLQFSNLKIKLQNYPNWFAKLYGIICYKAMLPILQKGHLQMDREYDDKNMSISAHVIKKLTNNQVDVYLRKEKEYPTNRIIVADLLARGYFKRFNCIGLIINNKLEFENEIRQIFKK